MDEEQPRDPVGSVAEETARLLDALGGWAQGLSHAGRPVPSDDASTPAPEDRPTGGPTDASRCAHCGADTRMGEALVCQVCPLCQGVALLRSVRPETVDRLADLAGALSRTLRDIAAERRGSTPAAKAPAGGQRVHDISVEDEDAAGSATTRGANGDEGESRQGRGQPGRPGSAAT